VLSNFYISGSRGIVRNSAFPALQSATSLIGAACVLALLYVGRPVLEPLALAAILSLCIAPLIHALCQLGLRHLPAVLVSLLLGGGCAFGIGAILAVQVVSVTSELPQYEAAIQRKADQLHMLAEHPFAWIEARLKAVSLPAANTAPHQPPMLAFGAQQPIPVEIQAPRRSIGDTLPHLLSLALGPIGKTGMVLVLLLFILLEYESLKDRLIRLAGQSQTSRTLRALADATQGVSRFFFAQFIVNVSFGIVVGLALWAIGIPHAVLWGTLSGILRFVPYLGALSSGALITLFAAANDTGWSLPLICVAVFAGLDLIVTHLIEPRVYGHNSGLSPLAVIVSALFWGSLWGPIGLLISTPLTVCLVVAGRHMRALEPITILLGEAPAVTVAQRFFQRVLSGETTAILRDASPYVRRAGFASYCDQVLMPGLTLAGAELRAGTIDADQQCLIRGAIGDLAEILAPTVATPALKRRRRVAPLDANIGVHLRQMREARLGRWQGPLDVPQHSIMLCTGLGSERDDLVSELLTRALREHGVDARSVAMPLPYQDHAPDTAKLVSTVFVVFPLEETFDTWVREVAEVRALLPQAIVVTILGPQDEAAIERSAVQPHVDMVLRSFEEGLAFVTPSNA
jgi:predicted PurR-regulated permease PerM